jgi:hypothetical protein
MMKKAKASFWEQSAGFYLGAGFVGEIPLTLFLKMDISRQFLDRYVDWPPPVWLVMMLALLAYVFTCWAGYQLGFGE